MNESMYSADRGTHLKIIVVGVLSAVLFAAIGLFAQVGQVDLGTAPLVKAGTSPVMSGHLQAIR
jgi:hypothetical protein